jgi:hypothetical protein
MLLGMTLTIGGYSAVQMAILTRVFYNFIPEKTARFARFITYNRGVGISVLFGLAALAILVKFTVRYFQEHMTLAAVSEPAIIALYLLLLSFQSFTFTLMFQMIVSRSKLNQCPIPNSVSTFK